MYKLFVKIDGYKYRLIQEAETLEELRMAAMVYSNPWKIEKDGEIIAQS